MGEEGQLEGTEGQPEGFEGQPEGFEGLLRGSEGLSDGSEGQLRVVDRPIGGCADGISAHSSGLCPLSGPLPKK